MSKADIIERGGRGTPNLCRCKHCGRSFEAGGNSHWHNHFYCSPNCGDAANRCSICSGNRNWCECRRTYSPE